MLNIGLLTNIRAYEPNEPIKVDDTYYYDVINNKNYARGKKLDQLIISDTNILNLKFVKEIVMPCLIQSCVTNEFLIQVYN